MRKYYKTSYILGKHPVFSQELFEKYDTPARNKLKEVLKDFIEDNPDTKQQDFIIKSDACKYKFLEVQVCANWIEDRFPYDKVYIHARKAHYGEDTVFLTMNKFLSRGYLFDAKSFKNSTPRRLKKYSREYVYDIPWNQVLLVYINTLDKETFELF